MYLERLEQRLLGLFRTVPVRDTYSKPYTPEILLGNLAMDSMSHLSIR